MMLLKLLLLLLLMLLLMLLLPPPLPPPLLIPHAEGGSARTPLADPAVDVSPVETPLLRLVSATLLLAAGCGLSLATAIDVPAPAI